MPDTRTTANGESDAIVTVVLLDESGAQVPGRGASVDPAELKAGNVLTLGEGRDRQHWRILDVEEGDPVRVRVAPARSTVKWSLLLLALLGAAWFVLDYFFGFLFG